VVEARKDTTVVLHPLADDRRILPIDRTGEQLSAPPSFMLVVSYNPGYQNFLKGMKPSTRQRFISLAFDFPHLEEVASTRLLVYAATLIKDGCEPTLACRAALVETLTDDPETAVALREVIDATFGK